MPTFDAGQSGLTGTVGVTVLDADGTVHTARATAGITEPVAGSGVYHVASPGAGLTLVWDVGVGTIGASAVLDDPDEYKADVSNLDAAVSSRLAAEDYTEPPSIAGLATEANATLNAAAIVAAIPEAPDNESIAAIAVDAALARKMRSNRQEWSGTMPDLTLTVYDDDDVTVLATFAVNATTGNRSKAT